MVRRQFKSVGARGRAVKWAKNKLKQLSKQGAFVDSGWVKTRGVRKGEFLSETRKIRKGRKLATIVKGFRGEGYFVTIA